VIMLAVNSALGLYYYIKIIATMFDQREAGEEEPSDQLHPSIYIVSGVTMALLTILLVWIGIAPGEILDLIQTLVILN
jgi:NADH-quinone oxidoreductase subunit N